MQTETRPHEELAPVLGAYLKQIKHKADCLSAFAPGGICERDLIRDWGSVEQLKRINQLLSQALAMLPVKGGG